MPTSRPFAYNTGASIPGTTQTGNLAVGTPLSGFTNNPQFWNGPDEELGYVIAIPVSGNTQPTPIPGVFASVGFYRSDSLTEGSFVTLTNSIFGQNFTTGAECTTYLNANGYWTSFAPSVITPTPTQTQTPTPSSPSRYTYLGRTSVDAASSGLACSTYATSRSYQSLRSSLASITDRDVIYDSYPTPVNGNDNWIALKSGGVGDAYSFQINSSGVVISVGGNCNAITPTPTQTPTVTPTNTRTPAPTLTPTNTSTSITPTPTQTLVTNIIYWSFVQTVAGTTFSISKNGTPVVSRTASDSGQFTHNPGDEIFAQTGESVKTSDWTQTCAFVYGGALLFGDKQQDSATSVTFTTSAGSYSVTGQEDTSEPFTCTSPEL